VYWPQSGVDGCQASSKEPDQVVGVVASQRDHSVSEFHVL